LIRTNDSDGDTVVIIIKSCEKVYCDRVAKVKMKTNGWQLSGWMCGEHKLFINMFMLRKRELMYSFFELQQLS
jgi:hypothetical protein